MAVTAGNVMDLIAGLLNDTAKTIFTYVIQVPYMNMAVNELQESFELNNIPFTNELPATVIITAGMTDIGGTTGPALPTDLIEIQKLSERPNGTTEDYYPMTRYEFLPTTVEITSNLEVWTWQKQTVQFIGANTDVQVLINYIGATIIPIVDNTTVITPFNAQTFLMYRTAALCAQFIGEDKERADDLNVFAGMAMDRLLQISTKGRQSIAVRRRPFQASYKSRGYF